MKHRIPYLLAAIGILTFLLRLFSISHGIPHHPDERAIIMMTEGISWEKPFPDSFAYGSLPFYLLKTVAEILSFLWPTASSYDGLFYVGRGLNALIAVWLVWTTYRLARTIYRRTIPAYWAAFLVGTNTFIIQNSHFFTVDLLLTTLTTEALIQMTRIPREGQWRQYLLAAVLIGLALATKIGALSLLAPAAIAFVLHRFAWRENPIPALCIIGGTVAAVTGLTGLGGLCFSLFAALLSWLVPRALNPHAKQPSFIFCRGWRYLFVCLPLILLLFFVGEPFAFDWKGWASFSSCLANPECRISTQIFSDQFLANVGGEIAMVRGLEDPRPYTVQYVGTTPYLYHLNEMFWTTLGPLIAAFALLGLIIELLTPPTKARAVPLSWAILFFLTVAGSFVKFPRYLLPLYPLLFCYTGWAISVCLRQLSSIVELLKEKHHRLAFHLARIPGLIIGSLILTRALSFTAIYTVPHPYERASQWVFDHIPQGSTILGVHWDDKLPLDLPGRSTQVFSMWSPKHEIAIYEPDSDKKIRAMATQLASADYIIFPSAKIPASIPRWPERYPFSSRLLRELFEGRLGFSLDQTIKNYPSLGNWYRIDDDVSDESLTLYDHPKVYIFRKSEGINADEIIRRVEQAPKPVAKETIRIIQNISADQGGNLAPFVPYTLGSIITWLLVIELLAWIVRFPLREYAGLSDNAAAFASRPVGIFLFFGLFWWLNSAHVSSANAVSLWILALACMAIRLTCRPSRPIQIESIQTSAAFFLIPFLTILCIRSFQSEIFWGEKPMDFSFLNYFYRATSLPPTDPWASGNPMRYYYLGSYVMAQLGKMAFVSPAIGYNLAIATVGAALVCSLAAILSSVSTISCRAAGWIGTGITFLSNPESVLVCWAQGKVTFDTFWASTRLFVSPSFTEYPLWAIIHADLHAHFIAAPLGILVALGLSLLRIRAAHGYQYFSARLFLGATAGLLLATNTWDVITLAVAGVASGLAFALSRLIREGRSGAIRICAEGVLDFIVVGLVTTIVALPFLRDGLSGATSLGHGYVYSEEFNNLSHLLRHFGIWLLIILIAGSSRFFVDEKKTIWWQVTLLFIFLTPAIFLFYDSAIRRNIAGVPDSYLIVSLVLALIAHQITCQFADDEERSDKAAVIAGLLWAGSFIILFAELRYVGDRMNTIFKFYTSTWWILGIAASWLTIDWVRYCSCRPRVSKLRGIAIACISLATFLSLSFWDQEVGFLITFFSLLTLWCFFGFFSLYQLSGMFRARPTRRFVFPPFQPWEFTGLALVALCLSFGVLGSLLNVFALTTNRRAPQPAPSIDGTAYLSRNFDSDWDLCRWLNDNVRGTPTIIEASGDAYQDYTRITMNTGLPTILGWEHHTNQRGTSRQDIEERKRALELFYSTPSAETAALILRRYNAHYVIVGTVERRLYGTGIYLQNGLAKFGENRQLFEPVFTSGLSTVYRFNG